MKIKVAYNMDCRMFERGKSEPLMRVDESNHIAKLKTCTNLLLTELIVSQPKRMAEFVVIDKSQTVTCLAD